MRTANLLKLCAQIESTPFSIWIQNNGDWFVPSIQVVHIFSIAVILISSVFINAKLLGLASSQQSCNLVIKRFSPAIFISLILLLVTGAMMIIGEPARSLANSAFQIKMIFLSIALAIFFIVRKCAYKNPNYWEESQNRLAGKILAISSMISWICIVFLGRWIAYL